MRNRLQNVFFGVTDIRLLLSLKICHVVRKECYISIQMTAKTYLKTACSGISDDKNSLQY